jgi:hypothetical protein
MRLKLVSAFLQIPDETLQDRQRQAEYEEKADKEE